jgi:spoIIIJ-associated protein
MVEHDRGEQIERGQQWLQELLRLAGLAATVQPLPDPSFSEDSCWLMIDDSALTPSQVQHLIGENGAVLDSVQYLANAILNLGQDAEHQGAFTVELAGYRLRRFAELKELAEQSAAKVRQTGQEFELKALSSAERRQVHTLLKAHADLESSSRGQEPDRRLVIRLLPPEA